MRETNPLQLFRKQSIGNVLDNRRRELNTDESWKVCQNFSDKAKALIIYKQ